MKISKAILKELDACERGFDAFVEVHGDDEILFSDCVKSESNRISDYLWFIRKQSLNVHHLKDLQLLAIAFTERVLPIFEKKCPEDKRPRTAVETAKLYMKGHSTLDELRKARNAYAAYDVYDAYAADAVGHTHTDYAVYAITTAVDYAAQPFVGYASYAAVAVGHAAAVAVGHASQAAVDAEQSWQKQQLFKLMIKWGW